MKVMNPKKWLLPKGVKLNFLLFIVGATSLLVAYSFFVHTAFERETSAAGENTMRLVSMLRNEIDISYGSFADDMRFKVSYISLESLLNEGSPSYEALLSVRRFYSLNRDVISRIWVLSPERKGRWLTCEKDNYFKTSELMEYQLLAPVSPDGITDIIEIPCYRKDGGLLYSVVVEIDFGKFVGTRMKSLSFINPGSWFFYMKPAGKPIQIRNSNSSAFSFSMDSFSKGRIFSDVSEGYDGTVDIHALVEGKKMEFISSYSPLGEKAKKGWIMVSMDKKDVLASIFKIVTNVSLLFVLALVSIVGAFAYFIFKINRAARELRESEEKWKFAIEGSGEGVWELDSRTGRIRLFGNSKKILGVEVDEIDGRAAYVHPDDEKKLRDALATSVAVENGTYECEYRFRTLSGEYKWILDRGMILQRDGRNNPLRMIGTLSDITGRKNSEEEIRHLSERLDLAIRASGIGVWDWNILEDKLIWDERMRKLYGIEEEDCPLTISDWTEMIDPFDRKGFMADMELSEKRKLYFSSEFKTDARDSLKKHIRAEAKVLLNDSGLPFRIIGVNYDITKNKIAEIELKRNSETARLIAMMSTYFINMNSSFLDDAINLAMGSLCRHLSIEVARIFRLSPDGASFLCVNDWDSTHGRDVSPAPSILPVNASSHWLRILGDGKHMYVRNFSQSAPPDKDDWTFVGAISVSSLLLLPLVWKNKLEGFICFMTTSHEWQPSEVEMTLLQMLEDIFLGSFKRQEIENALIENQRMLKENNGELKLWKDKISIELALAGSLQKNIFRPDPFVCSEARFMCAHKPAMNVGGDIFGIEKLPSGKLCLYIGDISGHGVGSALVSFMMKAIIMEAVDAYSEFGPARVCSEISLRYLDAVSSDFFVTFFIGIFDPSDYSWRCMNCGHYPPIVLGAPDGMCDAESIASRGDVPIGMGLLVKTPYSEDKEICFRTPPGSSILFFTDGLIEAGKRDGGEMCGVGTLRETAEDAFSSQETPDHAAEIISVLASRGFDFDSDDMTVITGIFSGTASVLLEKEIAPDMNRISDFAEEVEDFLVKKAWSSESASAVRLLCVEHSSNIIKHGSVDPRSRISFTMTMIKDTVFLLFADQGKEWSLDGKDKLCPKAMSEGGYGLMIIEKICKYSAYYRRQGVNFAYFIMSKDISLEFQNG
jgi:PAS domain S-box-containing protein